MIDLDKTAHVVSRMQTDQVFRKEVCLRNHYWFFLAYFTRHINDAGRYFWIEFGDYQPD